MDESISIITITDRFYIALFSAVEQTHCTHVAYVNYDWVTVSYYSAFKKKILSTEVVYWQRYLVAGATWNCCRLRASSVYTIRWLCPSLQNYVIQNHIVRVHVCNWSYHSWTLSRLIPPIGSCFVLNGETGWKRTNNHAGLVTWLSRLIRLPGSFLVPPWAYVCVSWSATRWDRLEKGGQDRLEL